MKRLLQISFDTLLLSIIPIIVYSLLGFILAKDLVNIFSITYPMQFIFSFIYFLFGAGPNITATKKKDESIVYTNMILGIIIGFIVTVILCYNCENFIKFMNVDINIYKNFCIFSFIMLYLQTTLRLLLEKKYYDGHNKYANLLSIIFNLIYLIIVTTSAIITKNQIITIYITIIIMSVILIILFFRNYKLSKFSLSIRDNIKYSTLGLIQNFAMAIIYLIGLKMTFSFGPEFIIATTLASLVTDIQWDMLYAIETAVKIDISNNKLNIRSSLKNAYLLLSILLLSSLIMMFILLPFYKVNISIFIIFIGVQVIDMTVFPLTIIRQIYLQINEGGNKTSINKGISNFLRILCSFIYSPYCTYIGQIVTMLYDYIYVKIATKNNKELNWTN